MLDPARALSDMARQHLSAGRRGKAMACLYRGLALVPERSDLHLELGILLRHLKHAAQSVARLRLAVTLDPSNADALLNLALANRDRRDRVYALSGFSSVIDLDPALATAWLERGKLRRFTGQLSEALGDLVRAVALDPNQTDAFALLGSCRHALHLADLAEAAFRRWVDLAPINPKAYRELASALHSQGKFVEAEPYWRRDLELTNHSVTLASPAWSGRRLLRDIMPTTRIGEIAKTLDIYVKTGKLGWRPDFRGVLVGEVTKSYNPTFLEYWKLHVDVVTEPSEVKRVFADRHRAEHPTRATRIGDGRVLQSDYAWQAIQAAWEGAGYSPVLSLKPEHAEYGQRYLAGHGVPVGSWFVTFHIRENGFHRDSYGNLRSCNAASYVPAMERVVAHGGWVCRVGDNTMTPLPNLPNLIDATRLAKRDEILDLFLIATARFMVCSTSGPSCIAVCFGTPQIFTNVFPLTERALGRANRFTPKTYRDVASGNLVPFSVAMKEFKLGSDNSGVVREKGIEVIDNTSEEIVEAVEEMITLSSGRDPNDNMTKLLQDSYDALCPASIPISHSRIAGSFIRRHAGLL